MAGIPGGKTLAVIVAAVVLTIYGWLNSERETQVTQPASMGVTSSPIPEFTYTNQEGKRFGSEELRGSVWVANVIYTRCPTIASPLTANMARLQEKLRKAHLDAELVSFSADPLFDRPHVLKTFADRLRVEFSNWNFLTHNDEPELHRFLKTAFTAPVERQTSPADDGPPQI